MSDTKNKTILFSQYFVLPAIFLVVTLLGGMRLSPESGAFIFLPPTLFNLVLAVLLLAVIFRGKLIVAGEWFSAEFSVLKNCANGLILLTIFSGSVQVINCLLPEKGLAFGLTAFFLLWTLWTNLFAELEAKKMLRSLAALLGFAFVFKYVFLASLVSAANGGGGEETWARKLAESLFEKVSLGLLEIPRFSAATGYVAFFTVLLYGAGLIFLYSVASVSSERPPKGSAGSAEVSSETTS
jgi:hypothetical protein